MGECMEYQCVWMTSLLCRVTIPYHVLRRPSLSEFRQAYINPAVIRRFSFTLYPFLLLSTHRLYRQVRRRILKLHDIVKKQRRREVLF